jgi:hypothetical protein
MTPEVAIETSLRPDPDDEIRDEHSRPEEKHGDSHLEYAEAYASGDLHYDNEDEEPQLHKKTYIALAAMISLQVTITLSVQGPPVAVSRPKAIPRDLDPQEIY